MRTPVTHLQTFISGKALCGQTGVRADRFDTRPTCKRCQQWKARALSRRTRTTK